MNYQDLNFMIKELGHIPYPECSGIMPDYKFGRLVYDSYAGSKSELTAILTYVYQHLTSREIEEVAMFLRMISMQEMKHLEMLGEMLVKLGCMPYYMSTYGNKWCSDNVRSTFQNLEEMLCFNVLAEKEAISGYRHLIDVCENENIKPFWKELLWMKNAIFRFLSI